MRLYFENIDCQHEKPIEECGEMYWICNCYEGSNDLDGKGVLGERPVIFGEESASLMNKCTNLLNIQQMSTPDDPVIHSPPSLRGAAPSALLAGSPGAALGSLAGRQQNGGVGVPSIAGALQATAGALPAGGMNVMDELGLGGSGVRPGVSANGCDSPSSDAAAEEARRRQKTCRVCGDHATGYNFNVITCESCKAFFRRNALRPKEFKCPYSDDCDINSVSRRFCQKCRLRKCFTVGMKKEWILNEEQLRRRKNSRLNHMQSQNAANNNSPIAKAPVAINVTTSNHLGSSAPTTPSGMGAAHLLSRRSTEQPMVSPPSVNSMLSPSRSTVSPSVLSSSSPDSPPTRGAILGLPHIDNNTDAYESNMMRLQRQQAAAANAAYANMRRNSCGPGLSPGAAATAVSPLTRPSDQFMIKGEPHVTMSVEEYQALLKAAKAGGAMLPNGNTALAPSFDDVKRSVYSPSEHDSLMNIGNSHGVIRPSLIQGAPIADYTELSVAAANMPRPSFKMTPDMEKKVKYMHDTIHDELNLESPKATSEPEALKNLPMHAGTSIASHFPKSLEFASTSQLQREEAAIYREGESKLNYQLNSAELRALDIVRDAFACMNEPIEDPRKAACLKKPDHNPTDILNIMDITMRRLVKMAKKLPSFNDLSQDGKFALLKGGMVEMLTMRGVTRFDMDQKCWRTPVVPEHYHVSLGMFDQLKEGLRDQQKDGFLKFCQSLHPDVRTNELAIDLIVLIVLFDSNREALIDPADKTTVSRHCQEYQALLHRYMESMYGYEARARYETLPESLRILRVVSQNAVTLFLGRVDPNESEALPKEFFKTTE
ncbi:Nuclear hormone receptor family member nhr-48 [Toxocara canis]|uniref:Nuclear hormone receptor family member nhr-48 n=1 Tax=Toxocara canis TaxID=6265 RepID=A0A0B2VG64_TOXCA|nr:Nuclear hormone receptor family member nhr-48 [Toxocara canis]